MSTEVYIPPATKLSIYPDMPPLEKNIQRVLEIGPGQGEFILHLAQSNPNIDFIGVELKKGRFDKISRKAHVLELNNLYMIRGDARECLTRIFAPELFDQIYILFPDPWPKRRHSKHRLIKSNLIKCLHKFLKQKGEIITATDALFYSEEILKSFEEAGGFVQQNCPSPFPTYFEQKWKAMGRQIDYWKFVKVDVDKICKGE